MSLDQIALFRDVSYKEEKKDMLNEIWVARSAYASKEDLEKVIKTLE